MIHNLGLFLVLEMVPTASAEAHCIWYGVCSSDPYKPTNCAYNGTAKPIPSTAMSLPNICEQGLTVELNLASVLNITQVAGCLAN
ncbi:hypothetical protein SFRURICE_016175 [Spodoptera frugiperda]|nr:hypothetical protein SFRURICE_016175 [Spodoptera frugiperda]